MGTIDVTRDEFNALKVKVEELEETTSAVLHLVAGGLNVATGVVDRGLVRSLADLVDELKELKNSIQMIFDVVRQTVLHGVRVIVGVIAVALCGWLVHSVWPVVTNSFSTTVIHTTTNTTHTTQQVK